MKIREALIIQSPSLALQRAAQDEIARLDLELMSKDEEIVELRGRNNFLHDLLSRNRIEVLGDF